MLWESALGPVLMAFFVFPSDFRRTSAENQRRQTVVNYSNSWRAFHRVDCNFLFF